MDSELRESRIYITYKTRMTTEARLRYNARLWQALISYYSFCLIVYSLIELSGVYKIVQSPVVMTVLAVATFGISLYISGERYQERADQFKNCYLKLQALYVSDLPTEEKLSRYAEILSIYENQSDDDYDEMLYDSHIRGQALKNASGVIEIPSKLIYKVGIKRGFRKLSAILLFLAPVAFGYVFIHRVGQ